MNKWVLFSLVLVAAVKLPAQTNTPVRLAVVSESGEAITAGDVLTVTLSGNGKVQLLERDEIEKVYREQGMSEANRDDLKLGRILGADGLLLLNVVRTPQATNLMTRLIAVKPGVVLTDGSFPWPLKDTVQWSESVATGLKAFLPKLSLLAKDAIPISIVNLRAAVSSTSEQETERDLKLLTIQRLSQEQQFFVLERQKMQLLSEEKELKSDESTFWDGSYLLDGIVDQNGYSKDTITINARLTPPKGGVPLSFEVSGSRTNLADVVNRLATKVTELLKVSSNIKEWNAAEEAVQYFDEAKWALRWGVYSEAEAAADSAWALGKKDLDCALVRVKSYLMAAPPDADSVERGSFFYSPGQESDWDSEMKEIADKHIAVSFQKKPGQIDYVTVARLPDSNQIDCALHALDLYYEFSLSSPDGEPRILTKGPGWNDWHNSEWYNVGIEALAAASQVLQIFSCAPKLQAPVAEKLAELRARSRSIAKLISETPSVHDSYYVGNRIAVCDELINTIGEDGGRNPNIFSCEAEWGCFWQEKPEDTIALYRKLMSSPVFCYIHEKFWFPSEYDYQRLPLPRLVAWNEEDQKRIPAVWNGFLQELNVSTNLLLQLEAKALRLADSDGGPAMGELFTNLFNAMFENRDVLIANNVDILYLQWHASDLVERMGGESASEARDPLWRVYYSQYLPKLEAMEQEYRNKTVPAAKFAPIFQKQVQYLKEYRPYEFYEFMKLFESKDYSKSQALEIRPLISSYTSNMVVRATAHEKFKARGDSNWIELVLGKSVNEIFNRPVTKSSPETIIQETKLPTNPRVSRTMASQLLAASPMAGTNILLVNRFLKVPYDQIQGNDVSGIQIFAERWCEGKLLIGLQYREQVYEFDHQGNWKSTSNKSRVVIAIFNPNTADWEMVKCPDASEIDLVELRMQSDDHRMILFQGNLFSCGEGRLQKFDFRQRQWQNLEIPERGSYDLFAVAGHLLATDANTILEIIGGGNGTRILASTRRRPVKSALDSLDNLGSPSPLGGGRPLPPELFSVSDHSIYANIGSKIFSWDGNDWHELSTPNLSQLPEIFQDAVIFRSMPSFGSDDPANLWIWLKNQSAPELALSDKPKPHPGVINFHAPGSFNPMHKSGDQTVHPLWKSPVDEYLMDSAITFYQSNLYFFVDHCAITNMSGQWTVIEENGYHAQLVCLSRDVSEPIMVPLKFDLNRGQPPLKSLGEKIEPWLTFNRSALATAMYFSHNTLFLSQRNTPGIWAIPTSEIELAVEKQKQILLVKQAKAIAAKKQAQEALLAKYDRNHNGIIDLSEREEALDDPAFIESQLDVIDTNHNDLLDPEELIYFDANQNKVLDPNELAGINIAEHLFAERLIYKFDWNDVGALDHAEFDELWQYGNFGGNVPFGRSGAAFPYADVNRDGQIDLAELEAFLKQQLLKRLQPRRPIGIPPLFGQMRMTNSQIDQQQLFKNAVEAYWWNSGSVTNQLPINRMVQPAGSPVNNGIPGAGTR